MNRTLRIILGFSLAFFPVAAHALPAIQERTSGDVYLHNKKCKGAHCDCTVSLRYLSVSGMGLIEAENTLNEVLFPQSDIRSYCLLDKSKEEDFEQIQKKPKKGKDYSYTAYQESTFVSDDVLAILEHSEFIGQGAGPIRGVAAQIFDLSTGMPVKDETLLDKSAILAANAIILPQLAEKLTAPARKLMVKVNPEFITPEGQCDDCTYVLRDDGLYAMFQPGVFGDKNNKPIEVKIPVEMIANEVVKKALSKSHGA